MKINFVNEVNDIKDSLKIVAKRLQFMLSDEGITVCVEKHNESYLKISGDNGKYKIEYKEIPHFLRGLTILIDKIKNNEKNFEICEKAAFEKSGILMDLSRNAVLKLDTFYDFIERIALMGHNTVYLYIEDIYKMDKYPYFGYMRGAYSKEELKKMDRYALQFGIELVPNIQTLGHLESPLRWSAFNNVKEDGRTLLIDEPKTYEFIEEMIKTMRECFSTNRIDLGLDEAHGAGRGVHLDRYGYEDKFELLSRHLFKVSKIAEKYGYTPIMADDMFYRLLSKHKGGYYQPDTIWPEDISDKIPENMHLVYWDYYNESEEFVSKMIDCSRRLTRPLIFFGGVWTWSGSINYDKTFLTMHPALKACRKEKINEVIATLWGDDGSETSIYASLLGLQLFAEYNFYETVSDEHLEKMFKVCTGYDMKAFIALDIDQIKIDVSLRDQMPGYAPRAITLTKQALYQDILQGLFDKNFEKLDLKAHYTECLDRLSKLPSQGDLEYLFDYQRQLAKVLLKKGDIGIRLTKGYLKKDRVGLLNLLEELNELKTDIIILHEKYASIWYRNNKAFGFDRLDLRFGGLIARVDRAYKRLKQYLNGEIEHIEELEEERLMFENNEKVLIHNYSSSDIISVSKNK